MGQAIIKRDLLGYHRALAFPLPTPRRQQSPAIIVNNQKPLT